MRNFSHWLAVPAVVLALTISACGKETPAANPAPVDTGPKAGPNCLDATKDGKQVSFGEGMVGVVLGKGKTGVVLAHQNGGSACQWLLPALELVKQGYLVLAFDFGGFGGSPMTKRTGQQEVADAVAAIRVQGATVVVLAGGSMGGTFSLVAATEIMPPVRAVVSLSAPVKFGAADAEAAAAKLTMPVLFMAGAAEPVYARGATSLHELTNKANASAELLIVGGSLHGVSLVTPDIGPQDAIDGFTAFIKKHAPAN